MALPITVDMQQTVLQRYICDTSKTEKTNLLSADNDFHNELINVFYEPSKFKASQFNKFHLPTILNYLRKTHQLYINCKLGEIQMELSKLTFKEDYKQYWMPMLSLLFEKFSYQLTTHIEDEENNLFPYIDSLILSEKSKVIEFSIEQKIELVHYLLDHDDFAERSLNFMIDLLKAKSTHFYDQLALGVLISRLKALETDLLIHAKIEDEVLIPKAMQLEIDILHDADITTK
jgi:regulator of cell morphogenesis and NO signaling